MITIKFKRGDTFLRNCQISENGVPIDITGWTIRSQIRDKSGVLVDNLVTSITNAATGSYTINKSAVSTASWIVGDHFMDIEFTTSAGSVMSTETVRIKIETDITK